MEKDDVIHVYERYHTYDYKEFLYWERIGLSRRTVELLMEVYNEELRNSAFESETSCGSVKTRELKVSKFLSIIRPRKG